MAEQNIKPKKKRRTFKEVVTHNLWLKILSVIFAVLMWCFVVTETNPSKSVTFRDISVTVTGTEQLLKAGLVPLERTDKLPELRVVLSVPYREIAGLSENNITAEVDLSKIVSAGTHTLPIRVRSDVADVSVVSTTPATVELVIEELLSSSLPVNIKTTGILPDGLYISGGTVDPQTISISGPASYISRITQAQVQVDLSHVTDGYIASMQYGFVDKNGNSVKGQNIVADKNSVLVDMGIVTKKTLPIEYLTHLKNSDKLAEGYELKDSSLKVNTVTVIGSASALSDITGISVKDVDLTGVSAGSVLELEYNLPAGVTVLSPDKPILNLSVGEKTLTETFTVPVTVNTPPGMLASSSVKNAVVSVRGGYFTVKNLTANDIIVTADAAALYAGVHTVPLNVMVLTSNPQMITANVAPSETTVTLSSHP